MKTKKAIRSPSSPRINRLFPYKQRIPFDPGLWKIIVHKLPEKYTIPDSAFTEELRRYNEKLSKIEWLD